MRIAPLAQVPAAAATPSPARLENRSTFTTILRSPEDRPAPTALPSGPLGAAPSPPQRADLPWARHALTAMLEDERKVDAGLRAAMRGQKLDAQSLLILQARVSHYTQEVDLASRLVDKATSAVKQIFQMQI